MFSQPNPPMVRTNLNTLESHYSAAVRPSTGFKFPNFSTNVAKKHTHSQRMSNNHVNVCINLLNRMKESVILVLPHNM